MQNLKTPEINEEKLVAFAGKVTADIAGTMTVLLSYMGDQTQLFQLLWQYGPCSAAELAKQAKVDERYLLEWLSSQAAAGYVCYSESSQTFFMNDEQALVLASEGHPACLQGMMQLAVSQYMTHEKALEVFRTGAGRPWGEHHSCCFCGVDRSFRTGYNAYLTEQWLPALEGMLERLQQGALVADVGCGHGSSTLLMAKAFPKSHFFGYDFHAGSINKAQSHAAAEGLNHNVMFRAIDALKVPQQEFDLICMFDALHDMGDPAGVARHLHSCLADDGILMLVEPLAGDSLTENMHLLGQLYYAASTLICTPASRAQPVGAALGAQAGQKRLTEVLLEAGFSSVRRAAQSDTNMVLEARK